MTHPRIQAHRAHYKRQADGIRSQLVQAERSQLADPTLTPAQRRRNIRHLRQQAETRLTGLAQQWRNSQQPLLRKLVEHLYRLPPRTMAVLELRDALERVNQVDSQDDAMRLWELSGLFGDEVMRLALAYAACPDPTADYSPKWPQIIAAWRRSDPAVAEALDSFNDAYAELADPAVRYEDSAMFNLPSEQAPPDRDQLPRLEPVPGGPAEPEPA
jgi:hypothetical protein